MKQKNLIIEEYQPHWQRDVQLLLRQLVTEEETSVMLVLKYFRTPVSKRALLSFADLVKDVGREQEFTVDVTLETDQWKRVRGLLKTLNRFSIRIRLWVTEGLKLSELLRYRDRMQLDTLVLPCQDFADFYMAYEKWKRLGLTVCPEPYQLFGEEFLKFFPDWLEDPDAVWPESFQDGISSLMTGLGSSDCRYSSCLGKYLYLDADDYLYFCKEKRQDACLGRLQELSGPLFEQERYQKALKRAIDRRRSCRESCAIYSFCKGGCPLEMREDSSCQELKQQIDRIQEVLEKELPTAFENVGNPCVRQLCLSLIAYGFRFVSPVISE